jgi:EmrB/QacA subfamily drug resistance transporter
MTEAKTPTVSWALVSLSLSMLLSSFGTSIANVALPTLTQVFTASFQSVQWVVLAYLLANTTLIVSVGRLGDIMGRRRLLLGGILLFSLASAACALAPSLWSLVAARAIQGLGAAVMMALSLALVAETVPKARTGSAMGLLGTMSAVGTALGPSLGGILITGFGWRSIFLAKVLLGAVALLLAYGCLPAASATRKPGTTRFDIAGTVVLALTLGAYALAMTSGRGNFGSRNIALLCGALAGAGLFLLVESKAASPLIRLSTFRNPALSAGFVMSALVSTVLMATLVVGPFYLSLALGLDAASVGIVMSSGPVVAALTGVPAGRIVDRYGTHRMILIGLAGITLGSLLLFLIPTAFGVAGYVLPIVLITANYALFQAANNTAIMTDVSPDQRGALSGVLNLSRNLGLITGASVMGAVFTLASGAKQIQTAHAEAVAMGMRITFLVAAVLIGVALAIAFASDAPASRRVMRAEK